MGGSQEVSPWSWRETFWALETDVSSLNADLYREPVAWSQVLCDTHPVSRSIASAISSVKSPATGRFV